MHLIQTASERVNTAWRLILRKISIGIALKIFRENNFVGISASHRESISDYSPLRLAIQGKDFSQIMDKTSENEPSRMAISPQRFCRLEQMVSLRQVQIRIALIDEGIEKIDSFPNAHFFLAQRKVLPFLLQHKIHSLMRVVEAVKLFHMLWSTIIIYAIVSFFFSTLKTHCDWDGIHGRKHAHISHQRYGA